MPRKARDIDSITNLEVFLERADRRLDSVIRATEVELEAHMKGLDELRSRLGLLRQLRAARSASVTLTNSPVDRRLSQDESAGFRSQAGLAAE